MRSLYCHCGSCSDSNNATNEVKFLDSITHSVKGIHKVLTQRRRIRLDIHNDIGCELTHDRGVAMSVLM